MLQGRLATTGPCLAHWVARVPDIAATCAAWRALGIERGPSVAASRETPQGTLRWQITVRDDGQRLFDGCLPTLIQWDGPHPTDAMPASPLALSALHLHHPEAARLAEALAVAGLGHVAQVHPGPPALVADWHTAP